MARAGAARRRHPDGARRVPAAAVAAGGPARRRRAHRGRGPAGRAPPTGTAATARAARRCSASCRAAIDPALRAESAERTVALGFDGYAHRRPVGGGDRGPRCCPRWTPPSPTLPADQPRYLMGVGDPVGLVEAIALGVDMFDCVLPTRLARHGTVLTDAGRLNLRNARHAATTRARSTRPAPARCAPAGPAAYLRHLLQVGEPTARPAADHPQRGLDLRPGRTGPAPPSPPGTLAALRAEVAAVWPAPAGARRPPAMASPPAGRVQPAPGVLRWHPLHRPVAVPLLLLYSLVHLRPSSSRVRAHRELVASPRRRATRSCSPPGIVRPHRAASATTTCSIEVAPRHRAAGRPSGVLRRAGTRPLTTDATRDGDACSPTDGDRMATPHAPSGPHLPPRRPLVAFGGLIATLVTGSSPLLGLDLQGGVSVVLTPTGDATDEQIDQAIAIMHQRINALGVAEPDIHRQGDDDRRRRSPASRTSRQGHRPRRPDRRAAVPARARSRARGADGDAGRHAGPTAAGRQRHHHRGPGAAPPPRATRAPPALRRRERGGRRRRPDADRPDQPAAPAQAPPTTAAAKPNACGPTTAGDPGRPGQDHDTGRGQPGRAACQRSSSGRRAHQAPGGGRYVLGPGR